MSLISGSPSVMPLEDCAHVQGSANTMASGTHIEDAAHRYERNVVSVQVEDSGCATYNGKTIMDREKAKRTKVGKVNETEKLTLADHRIRYSIRFIVSTRLGKMIQPIVERSVEDGERAVVLPRCTSIDVVTALTNVGQDTRPELRIVSSILDHESENAGRTSATLIA